MIHLKIITPTGIYLDQDVDFIETRAPHSVLGILPKHAPLVSTLIIGPLKLKIGNTTFFFAAGHGIINVRKDETVILLSNIERVDEIDIERAIKAKERAEARIQKAKHDEEVDITRAEAALSRALNRINIYNNYK